MTVILDTPVWSKSRVKTFRECHRKGLFNIMTQPEKAASFDASFISQVREYKNMKNRFLWSGSILHEAVGDLLKLVRQGSPLPEEENLIAGVQARMRDEYKASMGNAAGKDRLFEHAYRVPVPHELWQKQWAQVEQALRWFMQSSWLRRLQELGPECWKVVEEILSFEIDGAKAYVKIDCAVETGGRVILIDWKTSPLRGEDDHNLFVAALYAREVWEKMPEEMDAFTVSLINGENRRVPISQDSLEAARRQIRQDVAYVQKMTAPQFHDPFSAPATFMIDRCYRCNFQKFCHPDGV